MRGDTKASDSDPVDPFSLWIFRDIGLFTTAFGPILDQFLWRVCKNSEEQRKRVFVSLSQVVYPLGSTRIFAYLL